MAMHKVVWQEGMLLRPQHFQQNDRYYDYQLKTRTQKLDSYAWGFFELEIDRQFLNMGKLVVSKASGILPDGTLFDIGAEREPLALDVPPNTGNTPVYLALPLATISRAAARSSRTYSHASPLLMRRSPTPTPATALPARSAAAVRISACCSVNTRATRPTSNCSCATYSTPPRTG
jgi:hypothetical protein